MSRTPVKMGPTGPSGPAAERGSGWRRTGTSGSRVLVLVSLLCVAGAVASSFEAAQASAFRRAGWAKSGMVVTDSRPASEVGVSILRDGGNAIDAAAGTAFALAVTFPWGGNVAGGGFAVVRAADGETFTLDFREVAPQRAFRNMYLDSQGEVIPGLSLYSHLASGVPGSVDGLLRLWADHGSGAISRERLLRDAIRLARDGFEIEHDLAHRLNETRDRLERNAAAREIFVRDDGRDWVPGDLLVQRDLAASLQRIAQSGADGFYQGVTADSLVADMERNRGLIDHADLRAYRSTYRDPVRGTFRGYDLVSMGPPSSGGVFVIQILNMLETVDLDRLGWNSADYVHVFAEACRRAYADRAEHLGDPEAWDVPLPMLLSKEYARARMSDVTMERAGRSRGVEAGSPAEWEGETAHISVADASGNVVSLTTTLNAGFGSGIVVPGTGILLNNEMNDFSAKPGVPNLYGLVGNEANAIAPGTRMLSSMSPTLVLRDGRPVLVLGSPGGSRIITAVVQVILNRLVFGMPVAQAVMVPRVHAQWLPDTVYYEPFGLDPDAVADLRGRGHEVEVFERGGLGRVAAIAIEPEGFIAGPDVRGGISAAGY